MNQSKYPLSQHVSHNSPLVYGCMGLGGPWAKQAIDSAAISQAHQVIDTALEVGITTFDHADIYSQGKAEQVFGAVLKERPSLRSEIVLQSKCAIRFEDDLGPKRYDSSPQWIKSSVEGCLSRLGIEQLDILMLHRPDPLMEPELIAEAFAELAVEGKVKTFGVSNTQWQQIDYLQSVLPQPLIVNQIELSLGHLAWLEEGVTSGASGHQSVNFGAGTLEYCRKNSIQLQAWGSLAQGLFSGKNVPGCSPSAIKTAALVQQLATEYQVSREAILLAWLMKHPAHIQPVIGTTDIERIKACAQVNTVQLTRGQWYALYVSARGSELP